MQPDSDRTPPPDSWPATVFLIYQSDPPFFRRVLVIAGLVILVGLPLLLVLGLPSVDLLDLLPGLSR